MSLVRQCDDCKSIESKDYRLKVYKCSSEIENKYKFKHLCENCILSYPFILDKELIILEDEFIEEQMRKEWPSMLIPIDSKSGSNWIDCLEIINDRQAKYGKSPAEGAWEINIVFENNTYISNTDYYMAKHLDNLIWIPFAENDDEIKYLRQSKKIEENYEIPY